jgi:hypothetical protein
VDSDSVLTLGFGFEEPLARGFGRRGKEYLVVIRVCV